MSELPDWLVGKLDGLKRQGDGWVARCPVHEDRNPSMKLDIADNGHAVAFCYAGCDPKLIAAALGLDKQGRTNDDIGPEWTPRGPAVAVYSYVDEEGQLLFQVLRTANKEFPQRTPDPSTKTGWRWSLGDTRRVLYRLPEVIAAVAAGTTIYVVEGEKDVESLRARGKVATCNPGGAGKWRPEFVAYLIDAKVIVVADKDKPGQSHARNVAASLQDVASAVWVVEAADPHKDVTAHLDAGLGLDQLAVTHQPSEEAKPDLAPDIHELLAQPVPDYDWLVPGLLERGERFMLTGGEGLGKSMFMRMLAVCFAAGIHPTNFSRFAPLRVLVIDCENSLRQTRRAYRPIIGQAARLNAVPSGNLRVILRPEGINLPHNDDAAWLLERVTAHKPDVIVLGPLYRLHLDNPNDETTARKLVAAIDAARVACECAVMIEAHSGHGEPGKARHIRPVGSSLYLRWPEFGFGMRPIAEQIDLPRANTVEVVGWRGARDERNWPTLLQHGSLQGTSWPWVPKPEDWETR